jgi:hypothetical protein
MLLLVLKVQPMLPLPLQRPIQLHSAVTAMSRILQLLSICAPPPALPPPRIYFINKDNAIRCCRLEVPRFELQLARLIVTIFEVSFDGGSMLQKPPYQLSVELPALDDRMFTIHFALNF